MKDIKREKLAALVDGLIDLLAEMEITENQIRKAEIDLLKQREALGKITQSLSVLISGSA
ncbi:MAG: hypothetical protein AAF221_07900 [Pseudomonadota bacterium]